MELGLILGRNLEKPGKRQNLGVFQGFSRFNFLFLPFSRLFQVFQVFQVTWQPWSSIPMCNNAENILRLKPKIQLSNHHEPPLRNCYVTVRFKVLTSKHC